MDITGFDQQIGNPFVKKFAKGLLPKKPMTSAFSKARLQQVVAQAKAKGIIPKSVAPSAFSRAKMQQVIAQAKAKGLMPMQQKSITQKAFDNVRAKQAQIFARQRSMIPVQKTEIKKFEQSLKNMPSGKAAFAIFDKQVTPNFIKSLTPIQRTFTRTDLPYQPVNNKPSKIVRIRNTPLKYSLNINAIEPAVDNGSLNYYGK